MAIPIFKNLGKIFLFYLASKEINSITRVNYCVLCHCPIGESWKNDAGPKTLLSIKILIKYVHEIGKFRVH